MKNKRINLVTGASSSIGRTLIHQLIKRGEEVRVIVKRADGNTVESVIGLPKGVRPYICDLTLTDAHDKRILEDACRDVDRIYHIAGATYNYRFTFNQMIKINVVGTENLLHAYLEANKHARSAHMHLVYTSSVTVYGYRRRGEQLTEDSTLKPASNYSESKLMAERLIQAFAESHPNITYTILRFGTLYGSGYERSFFKVFELLQRNKMAYIGNGNNHVTLVSVDDAADAMLLAADSQKSTNKIYNITDGVPYTMRQLLEIAAAALHVGPPTRSMHPIIAKLGRRIIRINYDEYEFLASDRIVRISKAGKELGFKPHRSIEREGVALINAFNKMGN